jgi:nicotinamide-nucleotide amidase
MEMAEGVRTMAWTNCSLSSTGNLGPDVIEGKEKGLIYLAACKEGKTFTMELRLKGDRESNKKDAALKALEFLVKVVERDETLNSQVMV